MIKPLSQEKISKEKEIRKQRVYRLLHIDTQKPITLVAQESTTITGWIQAPFQPGEFTLRLLIYYNVISHPQDDTKQHQQLLKYRLIRHKWIFNVHECLNSEITCIITNMCNGELGLNIQLTNENKLDQGLTADIYINSLALNSENFTLSKNSDSKGSKIDSFNISGELNCLKPTRSMSMQCHLVTKDNKQKKTLITSTLSPTETINEYLVGKDLSIIDIGNTNCIKHSVPEFNTQLSMPKLDDHYSFLMNYETVYFKTNLNNEEFHNILTTFEPYFTFVINWTAIITYANDNVNAINDNIVSKNNSGINTQQRAACGQHFIKLKNMYEKSTCPESSNKSVIDNKFLHLNSSSNNNDNFKTSIGIIELASMTPGDIVKSFYHLDQQQQQQQSTINDGNPFEDENDTSWERNDNNVGQRCILVDEFHFLNVKA